MENTFPVLRGVNDLRLETHPIPPLGSNEVLIRMAQVGLCGSDLSLVYKGRLGDFTLTPPIGVGHEASGVVAKCGPDVKHLKPGDRVTIEPGGPCRRCDYCTSGKYNVCEDACFHNSVALYPGCLARYYLHNADLCFKLPDNVSDEEGAFIEPLAVAVHACRKAKIQLGSSVLICGAGPIGLLCLLTAKAMGATNILITDIKENRLKIAKRVGAHHTLLVQDNQPKSLAAKVKDVMGCMPQVTLECTGVQSGIVTGIYATRSGGVLMLVGVGAPEVTLPLVHAGMREVEIIGVYRYINCYQIAIDMIANGLIDVKPLITHRFKFEEFQKAFDMFHTGEDGAIKCMISCE
ncbi:sorbitol dehydrogenase isoform X2 [Procambarus clarkii]|uniref:sorbitol dehydrogenase isoform X2 n=1 Tax=Procambarus clarkii TaxID=6728 RepID=UPI001E678E3B|nr:sorbitol dehydrogenase-like [Procambarus clarkii]